MKSVSIGRIRPGGRHRPENIPHVLGMSLQVFPLPGQLPPLRYNSSANPCRHKRHPPHAWQSFQHAQIFPFIQQLKQLGWSVNLGSAVPRRISKTLLAGPPQKHGSREKPGFLCNFRHFRFFTLASCWHC
jgi:hypothetical protein